MLPTVQLLPPKKKLEGNSDRGAPQKERGGTDLHRAKKENKAPHSF